MTATDPNTRDTGSAQAVVTVDDYAPSLGFVARENVARLRCKACGSDVVQEQLGSFVSGFRCPQCDGEGR